MPIRPTSVAGMFYPDDAQRCRQEILGYLPTSVPALPRSVLGGLVPHAGWAYSGATAARVFAALQAQGEPQTLVLFGAVHHWGVTSASLYGAGAWSTPLGNLQIDEELAQAVLDVAQGAIVDAPEAHADEHAIEVQCPFIKHLFPEARFLPVALPPLPNAPQLGALIAQAVRQTGRRAVAIASSDLTHYGPHYGGAPAGVGEPALAWTKANDQRLLDLLLALEANQIVSEAQRHHNACGAGAIAAMLGFAQALGASEARLLGHTTSYEVRPVGLASDLVGYAAAVVL